MQTIQLPNLNDFVVAVTLDGTPFRLHLAWNDRAGLWTLEIRDAANVPIVAGVRCVPNWPLLRQYRRPQLPPGELVCVSQSDKTVAIGRQDFVTGKIKLVYVPEVEVDGAI